MYVNRLKGKNSKGHQSSVKDFPTWICSSGESLRSNGAVRRPSASASNTIHLRGDRLRSIPAFSTSRRLYILERHQRCPSHRRKQALTYPSVFLRTRLLLCEGAFLSTLFIRVPGGWVFVVSRRFMVTSRSFLLLWFWMQLGSPSISVFGQKLNPALIKSQCMRK